MEINEAEVRKMRDIVYGDPASDKCWNGCKENWMKMDAILWLQQQVKLIESKKVS